MYIRIQKIDTRKNVDADVWKKIYEIKEKINKNKKVINNSYLKKLKNTLSNGDNTNE